MNTIIDMEGKLIIYAENDLEAYALSKWFTDYIEDSSRVVFGVDTVSFNKVCGRLEQPREDY